MIKIMGIGSPFAWDRVGFSVVKALAYNPKVKQLIAGQQLKLELLDRPGMNLIHSFKDAKKVILLDAIKLEDDFASIHILNKKEIQQADFLLSSHSFGIGQAVALAESLQQLPEEISFYGINIANVEKQKQPIRKLSQTFYLLRNSLKNSMIY